MTAQIITERPDPKDHGFALILGFVVLSLIAHVVLFFLLASTRLAPPKKNKAVDMEVVVTRKPPPKEPPVEKKPEPPKPIEKPKPVKVAKALPPPPKDPPPPPPQNAPPPPPNQPPPPKAPPTPINIGLSLSSTTQAGSFAAPVGNTMYGKPADHAADPNASKPYQAPAATEKFVPSYQLDEAPTVIREGNVKQYYPDDARKEGLEGQVVLQLRVDETGHVVHAKVLQGAGHGFDEAAVKAVRDFLFRPGKHAGQPVATEITYKMTFLLN